MVEEKLAAIIEAVKRNQRLTEIPIRYIQKPNFPKNFLMNLDNCRMLCCG